MPSLPSDASVPDWAVAEANAALRLGLSVPAIEQRLVGKGLPPSTAAAAVNAALDGRLQAGSASAGPSGGTLMAHRAGSALVACSCLVLAFAFGGGPSVGRTVPGLLLPVTCIWWAEALGASGPPVLVRWTAWVVLLLIGAYRIVLLAI